MKTSTIGVVGSLLVSGVVSATGIAPILDLDFTRTALETLKKRGIDDACIVAASSPGTFTYCREGSSTLWQYQTLDLVQQAKLLNEGVRPATDHGQITVAQDDSAACDIERPAPVAEPDNLCRPGPQPGEPVPVDRFSLYLSGNHARTLSTGCVPGPTPAAHDQPPVSAPLDHQGAGCLRDRRCVGPGLLRLPRVLNQEPASCRPVPVRSILRMRRYSLSSTAGDGSCTHCQNN